MGAIVDGHREGGEGFVRPFVAQTGITEHVEEDGLAEVVEVGEGFAALGAQGVGLIQDPRNPPLLAKAAGNGISEIFEDVPSQVVDIVRPAAER